MYVDGVNLLVGVLVVYGGVVMWCVFVYVYDVFVDWVVQVYIEFVDLDGVFLLNVIFQIKNGFIDFQLCELFYLLFGVMLCMLLMMEVQIIKEYFGFVIYLVYFGLLYQEVLWFDFCMCGQGDIVVQLLIGMVGVVNIGNDCIWSGLYFDFVNWYVFGCLVWNLY